MAFVAALGMGSAPSDPMFRAPFLVVLLVGSLFAPLVAAGGEPPLIPCDNTPGEVLFGILGFPAWFLMAVLTQTELVAGKVKCNALHALGVCSDESLPAGSAFSTGALSASGKAHAHRDLCYEYFFVPPTCGDWTLLQPDPQPLPCLLPGAAAPCPAGMKLEHRIHATTGEDAHRCVLLTTGLPLPLV